MSGKNRLGQPYDVVLHLLDRQVLDRDGLMVCNVDDVELTETDAGLTITALYAGSAAWLPRVSGPLGRAVQEFWGKAGAEQADRRLPYRIDFSLVDRLDSAVTLSVPQRGVLVRTPGAPGSGVEDGRGRHRLGSLLSFRVVGAAGGDAGRRGRAGRRDERQVLDVRVDGQHVVRSARVGKGRIGANLGYDRNEKQGPALVRAVVRWLHRHQQEFPIENVHIDWTNRVVTIGGDTGPR